MAWLTAPIPPSRWVIAMGGLVRPCRVSGAGVTCRRSGGRCSLPLISPYRRGLAAPLSGRSAAVRISRNVRVRLELGLAIASAALAVVTLISREWIEFVFGVDPDGGSGSLEWLIVALLLALSIAMYTIARWERRALVTEA